MLAALVAALAVAATIHALAPPAPATQAVLVAARDLPAGATIATVDVRRVDWPRHSAPDGVLTDVPGRVLTSPLRAGEPVTDARVAGPGLLTGQPHGTLAVPVRLADPATAAFVRSGDRVDVLAGASTEMVGDDATTQAQVLASRAVVLTSAADGATSPGSAGEGGPLGGLTGGEPPETGPAAGLIVLGVDSATAGRLAAAGGRRALSIALRASR